MGYDYEAKKDCTVTFLVTDYSNSNEVHQSAFPLKKGQRIQYQIYASEDDALIER